LNPTNKLLIENGNSKRRIVFVDSKVFKTHASNIKNYFEKNNIESKILSIDISEDKKNLESLLFMLQALENFGISRRSEPIIAIGGGVLLDIVGLAANLYRRGVPYIKVPTTLLAIVDASVGVKTAINHFGRRNRLGSYYAPIVAYLDRSFLQSLEEKEFTSAMGEIIKMAVIKNKTLFEILEKNVERLIEQKFLIGDEALNIISIATNSMIEELEPNLWEKNLKRIVDFGHSFSPLLEMKSIEDSTVRSLMHGEAVAIDIVFSCCLAFHKKIIKLSDLKRVVNLCKVCKIEIYHPYFCDKMLLWHSLLDTVRHRDGNQNLPIPNKIGSAIFLNDVSLEDVENTIDVYKREVS
jgi:3-dehydroquinate synthase